MKAPDAQDSSVSQILSPLPEDAAPAAAGKRDCMAACLQARAPGPRASTTGAPPVHLSPSQAAARDATSAAVGQHPLAAVGVSTASPIQAAAPAADFAGGDSDEAIVAVGNSFSRTAPCLLPEQDQVRKSVCKFVEMQLNNCMPIACTA